MACRTSLSKESHVIVKFLNSIGNLMACHVSLTKEISGKCQISEWYRKCNSMPRIVDQGNVMYISNF